MPNLRHVADLVAGELHHIDVVRPRALAKQGCKAQLQRPAGIGEAFELIVAPEMLRMSLPIVTGSAVVLPRNCLRQES